MKKCKHKKQARTGHTGFSLGSSNMYDTVFSRLPLLFLGFSGIYLPLGDYVAGVQFVDWDVLAAVQLLNSQQAQSSRVLGCSGLAMCFQSAHDMYVSACLCAGVV